MKKIVIPVLCMAAATMMINWGSVENSHENSKKQSVNFYGQLETCQQQTLGIENISIDNSIKQIPFYEKPAQSNTYQLSKNPITNFMKILIDLKEIISLEIPNPEIIWFYKKENSDRKTEYLEAIITLKDKTTAHYLVESSKKIYCFKLEGKVTPLEIEIEVPLAAVKKLTIEGFRNRDTEKLALNEEFSFDITTIA